MGYGIRYLPALAVLLMGTAGQGARAFEGESEGERFGGTRFENVGSASAATGGGYDASGAKGGGYGEGSDVLPPYAPEAAAGVRHKTASFFRRITRWGPADLSGILTNRTPKAQAGIGGGVRVSYYQPTADSRYDNYFEPQEISGGAAAALMGSGGGGAAYPAPKADGGYAFKIPQAGGYDTTALSNGSFAGYDSSFSSYLSGGAKAVNMAYFRPPEGALRRTARVARSSGFFVDGTHVLTNAHAVRGCTQIVINDQFEAGKVRLLAVDRVKDVALLQTPFSNDVWPEIASSDDMPGQGESIRVAGYPTEFLTKAAYQEFSAELTRAYAPGVQRIHFTKGVRKGNSGGPLLSGEKVTGMVVGRLRLMYAGVAGGSYTEAKATGVAVPAPAIRSFLKETRIRLQRCSEEGCKPSTPLEYTVKISCFK